ncbi:hypothetical protein L486_07793 [Kwoniella mangroviensis CBS 10435]|uniref:DUF1014 domain-containing protein n=1 Tax=Kwoniella mangroviensis CBS 10435 TaxID=1331196 RepID=A0A1B9IGU3_9TREE|nr:uncharacterized protein I203_07098 [Kwoniella mangroviensis CBS 8507]OCF54661.1 hypothetical protein L486_07793 [Kwoniella mangroviensis CBS 10435]OCF63779.1 hypothetical protein I203_07098 [Kwoniella mangroviensis CBS 8507]OCF78711.1 hypothetical protein I204_00655 [Kwoniella mangroviensis CBS 8886]
MAPKGGNAKKESGRAKKAENEEKKGKAAAAAKEAKEAEDWKSGAKNNSKADAAANKAAEAARKKAEKDALLAAEEASLPTKAKSAPKASGSKVKKNNDVLVKTGSGVAGYGLNDPMGHRRAKNEFGELEEVPELSAQGLEEMLEAMELAAISIDAHPERRFKAAFEAYYERELPILKEEHKGLRLNQMRDILFKQFQKSPENPFNQAKIAYNATKDEKVEALQNIIKTKENKYTVQH